MAAPPTIAPERVKWVKFGVSVRPPIERLIDELRVTSRQFTRSKLITEALIEKADRDLPANWRETVGFEDESAA